MGMTFHGANLPKCKYNIGLKTGHSLKLHKTTFFNRNYQLSCKLLAFPGRPTYSVNNYIWHSWVGHVVHLLQIACRLIQSQMRSLEATKCFWSVTYCMWIYLWLMWSMKRPRPVTYWTGSVCATPGAGSSRVRPSNDSPHRGHRRRSHGGDAEEEQSHPFLR